MKEMIEKSVLTNEERRYFGLEPIHSSWERYEVKEGFIVYFDGDVIRKTISGNTLSGPGLENYLEYTESDNEIYTRERSVVLPRTARGKEKKLNFTAVNQMSPTGCSFSMNLKGINRKASLHVYNGRNSINLPIRFPKDIDTLTKYRSWMGDFIKSCPTDYFDKVLRMKNTPHRTVKYYNGDIFRFEVDLEHYGFGLIIGQIQKMIKDGHLPKEHILCSIMGVSLLVRMYKLKTREKDIDIKKLTSYPLSNTIFMMDNKVIWGAYDIVGNKKLNQTDIDFPILASESINFQDRDYVNLCWGTGMILRRGVKDFPESLKGQRLRRSGAHPSVETMDLDSILASKEMSVEFKELEQTAFQYFGLPDDITFDEFNRQNNGLTAKEYAEYANKSGRVK